jgi:hypothetical protein
MDGDGAANSIDAGLVLQHTAGLILSRVQFSLNVTRPAALCDDAEKPSVCNVPAATEFGLSIALSHPPPEGYIAFQTTLALGGLAYNATTYVDEEVVWPDSGLPVRYIDSFYLDVVGHGALSSTGPPFRASTHRGDLVRLSITCTQQPQSHDLELFAFDAATNPTGSAISLPSDAIAPSVVVGTGALLADDDGDGMTDREVAGAVAARLRINCVE